MRIIKEFFNTVKRGYKLKKCIKNELILEFEYVYDFMIEKFELENYLQGVMVLYFGIPRVTETGEDYGYLTRYRVVIRDFKVLKVKTNNEPNNDFFKEREKIIENVINKALAMFIK